MTAITNTDNLGQYKSRISFILEQKLAFTSSSNLVREVKNSLQIPRKLRDDVLSY